MQNAEPEPVTDIDRAWEAARAGDHGAFAAWVRSVEHPLRLRLHPFRRAVDPEEILQEVLMRMWILAPTKELEGENASLRYAMTVLKNHAREVAKRNRLGDLVDPWELEELERENPVEPDSPPDPILRRVIEACLEKLPHRPREVIRARIGTGPHEADRDLAATLGMKLNTFLQNIVRARRALKRCLEDRGVRLSFLT